MNILQDQLKETAKFIAGPDFSLADIPIGLSVNRWFATPMPLRQSFPAVSAYFDRLTERPSFLMHGRNDMP